MSDSFNITPGSGSNVATRSVGNIHYQKVMGDLKQYEVSSGWGRGDTGNHLPATPTARMMLTQPIRLQDAFLEGAHGSPGDDNYKPDVAEIVSFDIFSGHEMVRGTKIDSNFDTNTYKVHEKSGLIGIVYTIGGGAFHATGTNIHTNTATGEPCTVHADDADIILAVLNFQKTIHTPDNTSTIGVFQYKMINMDNEFRAMVAATTSSKDLYVRLMVGTVDESYNMQPGANAPFTAKIVVDRIVF